jgi:carboxylesterase type B
MGLAEYCSLGGDPAMITVGGHSAGGCSVHAHVLEAKLKAERPLFRHAIIQSGAIGTFGPMNMEEADDYWEVLCSYFGMEKTTEKSRVELLQKVAPDAALQAVRDLGWSTFALTEDNLTLTANNNIVWDGIPFIFDFGSNEGVADLGFRTIGVLIGDTERDVSSPRVYSFTTTAQG